MDADECLGRGYRKRIIYPSILGKRACDGQNQSNLCQPSTSQLPTEPKIFPNFSNQQSTNPYHGIDDVDLENLLSFWENIANPVFKSEEIYWIYEITSKNGYKALRYTLPLGPIEATFAAIRQGYQDSWTQDLTIFQRGVRIFLSFGETYLTDLASGTAGGAMALAMSPSGPIGSAAGYGLGASIVTGASDLFWKNTANPWLYPILGLGVWP